MSDYSEWQNPLVEAFSFLRSFGFSLESTRIVESRLLGDSLLLVFSAKAGFRKIDITFYAGSSRAPASITIVVRNNRGRSFLLADFLKAEGKGDLASHFIAAGGETDLRPLISNAAKTFREICDDDLKPIIAGPGWKDVPFDWKGYR